MMSVIKMSLFLFVEMLLLFFTKILLMLFLVIEMMFLQSADEILLVVDIL